MTQIIDRENTIVGDAIIRHQTNGHVEVFSDTSGVSITSTSGNVDFKDQYTSGYINLSESGEADLITVNSKKSIVGLLNQVPKFWVSSNDTTASYAEDKIVGASGITVDVINDGGNEQLQIGVSAPELADIIAPYIVHNNLDGLQGGISSEYYHLTALQLIDLTSGISADNQHFHNASAVVVDDSNFDIISGIDLQTILEVIDEQLKTRNTLLVNFDIGGSIRNGNTSLGVLNDVPFVQFKRAKLGLTAFSARVPENYIAGTALALRIKWYSDSSNTNDVYWRLTYKGLDDGELTTGAGTDVNQVVAEPGAANTLVETSFTIPGGTFVLGDIMTLVVKRVGDDVLDTASNEVNLVEVSLDY